MTSEHPKRRGIPPRPRALDTERVGGHEGPHDHAVSLLAPEARAVLIEARLRGLQHLLRCSVCRGPPFQRRCRRGSALERARRDADREHVAARRPHRRHRVA